MPLRSRTPRTPDAADAVAHRLAAQGLHASRWRSPEDVVAWFGAVQAQEYGPARWALGLRADGIGDQDVARAFDEGRLIRTHVLRPTWHFVTPSDLRWMLALTGPRIKRAMASSDRRLEIDAPLVGKARDVFERTLAAQPHRTRVELAQALAAEGIQATTQRLAHLVMHAELDAVICSGPRRGKQFTYALVDQRAPAARVRAAPTDGDHAAVALVTRFFRSHGPATARDFHWWSGLRLTDTIRILHHLRAPSREIDGLRYWWLESDDAPLRGEIGTPPRAHLLPIYDEYTVAYRDRRLVPHGDPGAVHDARRGVVFQHAVLIDGQIVGTWRVDATATPLALHVGAVRPLSPSERRAIQAVVARYEGFLGVAVRLRVAPAR